MATYTVKSGDTLTKIANKYNTSVSAIQKANSSLIKDVNKIMVGWVLTIPTTTNNVTSTTDKNALIGKQVVKVLADIKNLQSYNELLKLL